MYELIEKELSNERRARNRTLQSYCASSMWIIALVVSILLIQDELAEIMAIILITTIWITIMKNLPWGKITVPTQEDIKFRAKTKLTETSDKGVVYQLRDIIDS